MSEGPKSVDCKRVAHETSPAKHYPSFSRQFQNELRPGDANCTMLLFLFWYSDLALLQFELHTVHLPGSLDAQDASMQFVNLHTGIFRWQRPTTPGIAGMSGVVPLQFSPSTYPLKTLNFLYFRRIRCADQRQTLTRPPQRTGGRARKAEGAYHGERGMLLESGFYLTRRLRTLGCQTFSLLRTSPPRPSNPEPNSRSVAGSGVDRMFMVVSSPVPP